MRGSMGAEAFAHKQSTNLKLYQANASAIGLSWGGAACSCWGGAHVYGGVYTFSLIASVAPTTAVLRQPLPGRFCRAGQCARHRG